jgi:tRNA dimethylallyltransferase
LDNQLNHADDAESVVNLPKIVVISGPTAVGKTALGIELALKFNGEVINTDSRYLYRGMNIGVAKPSLAERRGVPHHLIDICDPNEGMSLATFQELAMSAIAEVQGRGKLPFLVGGTPLYVNAVVENWTIPRVPPHPDIRARLEAEVEAHGLPALAARLEAVDPVAAERSRLNPRRVIRALEIHEVTGQAMSKLEGKGPRVFDALELELAMPREQLYDVIDARVDGQIADGLVEEVRGLIADGLSPSAPAMSSIGYRQLVPYLEGRQTIENAIAQIKLDTHRFVRKQSTWFRHNPRLIPVDVTARDWKETVEATIEQFLNDGRGENCDEPSSTLFESNET